MGTGLLVMSKMIPITPAFKSGVDVLVCLALAMTKQLVFYK